MKIGVVGYGFVGKSTVKALRDKAEIKIHDPKLQYEDDLTDCNIIFICINETDPEMVNLENLIKILVTLNKKCFFVIRTTVLAGITDYLAEKYNREFVFMPEFLREWNFEYDTDHPDKIVIGTKDDKIFELLSILFKVNCPIIQVSPTEAELAKLALNSLATIKVVFAEELFDLAQNLKADYNNIYKIFEADQNINPRHLIAGKDGYRGADGKCLKKDSNFLVETSKKFNSRMSLLETAVKINEILLKMGKL